MDLSVNFAGLELKNPLVVSSSDVARDIRQVRKAADCGAAMVILKAAVPPHTVSAKSKMRSYANLKEGIIHGLAGARRLSYQECLEIVRAAKKETPVKLGVNIGIVNFEEPYVDFAQDAARAGADLIELNFTPQIQDWSNRPVADGARLASILRDIAATCREATRNTKQVVNVPVMAKVRPPGLDVVSLARAVEEGGADAINAINGNGGSIPIDIYHGGQTLVPFTKRVMMTTFGAPLKYFAQGIVAQISRAVKIPVMGTGGMMNWRDAVEMIMFGATTVAFSTLLMLRGFEALTQIEKGIARFMQQQGYNSVAEFRGLAHQYISDSITACDMELAVARVNAEKCTGCGICLKPAHCLAMSLSGGKAVVNESECMGCSTCYQLCPAGAISLVKV